VAHAGGVAFRRGQHLPHHLGGAVRVALAQRQLHQQAAQRVVGRSEFDHAAERLLGEGQQVLAQVGEAQRVEHARIVGQALAGGRQHRQRAVGVAAAQRDHAFDGAQFRAVRLHARGHAAEALGLVDVLARQRQVRLHQVGGELVGVERGGALQRLPGVVDAALGQQQAGVLQVQVGIVRRQRQRLFQAGLRGGGVALLLQGQRQPAVRLRLLRFGGDPLPRRGDSFVGGVAAQGLNDRVLHGGPA